MTEWRAIPGFERYEVSDDGRVRTKATGIERKLTVKDCVRSRGYVRVRLQAAPGRSREFGVHRLVALAFIANPEAKREVNHIDHDKANNHVSNLEWVTPKENAAAAVAAGAYKNRKLRAYEKAFDDAPKPCVICGTIMTRRPKVRSGSGPESTRSFAKKRFCSRSCQAIDRARREGPPNLRQPRSARSIRAKV